MLEIPDKFIKQLKTLDNYLILRQEKDYLILGTKIFIKEYKELLGNVFQPHSEIIDREIPVFFFVLARQTGMYDISNSKEDLGKGLKVQDYPVLYLNKKDLTQNATSIKDILDSFVYTTAWS